MRKQLSAIAAMLMASSMSLMACSSQNSNTDTPAGNSGKAAYPTAPITMVVAWSAGGGTDIMTRAFAQGAQTHLGQQIKVVNKPGSSGAIGWGEIAHSTKADGYTLTIVSPEIGFMREKGLYDFGLENFTLITLINEDPAALAVRADAPWKTVEEFVAAARATPGSISVGNSGPGLVWDLATTAIERSAKIQLTHVPYDGAATASQAVLGGTLDAMTFSVGEVSPLVAAGKMKVLGLAAEKRLDALPNIPTLKEKGFDVQIGTFRGIAGPDGMDPKTVSILNDAFIKMAKEKTFVDVMTKNNYGINVMPTAEFQPFFKNASGMYGELLKPSK